LRRREALQASSRFFDTLRAPLALQPQRVRIRFAASGLDIGYLTTRPSTRTVFHNTQNTDPAVIALDEQLKQS
jgi:hypothetical protein